MPWRWLMWFGLLHGAKEWLDLLALALGDDPRFTAIRLVLMGASFFCLLEFGRRAIAVLDGRMPGCRVPALFVILAALGGLAVCRMGCWNPLRHGIARWVVGRLGFMALSQLSGVWPDCVQCRRWRDGALCHRRWRGRSQRTVFSGDCSEPRNLLVRHRDPDPSGADCSLAWWRWHSGD